MNEKKDMIGINSLPPNWLFHLIDTTASPNKIVNEIRRKLGDQFNADNPHFDFSRLEKWIINQFPHVRKDQS